MSSVRRISRWVAAEKPANSLISAIDRSPVAGPDRVAMVMLPHRARRTITPEACIAHHATKRVSGGLNILVGGVPRAGGCGATREGPRSDRGRVGEEGVRTGKARREAEQ